MRKTVRFSVRMTVRVRKNTNLRHGISRMSQPMSRELSHLSPALAAAAPLSAIEAGCDLCVPMKYGVPETRVCVGLLRAENAHLATVRPLYYRAEPSGGRQGPWQITALSLK